MLCWGFGQAELCWVCEQTGGEGSGSSLGQFPAHQPSLPMEIPPQELIHSLLLSPLLLLLYHMVQETPHWHMLSSRFLSHGGLGWGSHSRGQLLVGRASGGSQA